MGNVQGFTGWDTREGLSEKVNNFLQAQLRLR